MLGRAMTNFALQGAEWVLWLLVVLSVLCVFVAAERAWTLRAPSAARAAFEHAVGAYLKGGALDAFEAALRGVAGTESRVLLAGLGASSPDAAADAMAGTLAFERLRMERGLIVIGTVASNAPYVGLFGTVLGVIQAFHNLTAETAGAANAVMSGISEALVSTAVGLLVAIPSVVLYNYFTRRIKERLGRLESLGQLVLSRMRAGQAV